MNAQRRTVVVGITVVLLSLVLGTYLASQPPEAGETSILISVLFYVYYPAWVFFYLLSGGVHGGVSMAFPIYAAVLAENLLLWALARWISRRLTNRSDGPAARGRTLS
jgi:hypothetical protein